MGGRAGGCTSGSGQVWVLISSACGVGGGGDAAHASTEGRSSGLGTGALPPCGCGGACFPAASAVCRVPVGLQSWAQSLREQQAQEAGMKKNNRRENREGKLERFLGGKEEGGNREHDVRPILDLGLRNERRQLVRAIARNIWCRTEDTLLSQLAVTVHVHVVDTALYCSAAGGPSASSGRVWSVPAGPGLRATRSASGTGTSRCWGWLCGAVP